MPFDFYQTVGSPACLAVRMTATHLNISFNLIDLNMEEGDYLKPEFIKINPAHTIPTIIDNGFTLWESRAINRYLVNQYAPGNHLYPDDPKRQAVIDRLLDFDLGTLYPIAGDWMYTPIWKNVPRDAEKEKVLSEKLKLLDQLVGKGPYAAGEQLTIADFSLVTTLQTINAAGHDLDQYSNLKSWLNRLEQELPYYKEFVESHIKALMPWFEQKKMPINFYEDQGSPACLSIKMVVNHLNIPVNLIRISMPAYEHLNPEFVKINPAHTIPTIVDNGFTLWESRAIMRYLVNEYSFGNDLYPNDAKKQAIIDRMLDFDLGSLYPTATEWMYPPVLENKSPNPEKEEALSEKLKLLDYFLSKDVYVAGDNLTIADFSLLSSVITFHAAGHNIDQYANIKSWLNRLEKELSYYNRLVLPHIDILIPWFAPLRK
ncbi:uncharacterized protein B4U79_15337 [Dinothrombium tinctorium]|uniref:Uncharacterized protein n=1 Tax=Dinothrombium tinctorium TaxID=1965070 RepID=A0A3S3NWT9_9ACAR|nr:uncharacterized protein B4U79_15337 [Dinothrombium tinctorium]